MFDKEYKVFYDACTQSPKYESDGFRLYDVTMDTHRLYVDDRDIYNDTWYPNWKAEDDFIICISKVRWNKKVNHATSEPFVQFEVRTTDKNLVNQIYYNVAHGVDFWVIVNALKKMNGVEIKQNTMI